MKTKKLLRRIGELLSADRRAQRSKFESLEKVLRKLAEKEADLWQRITDEQNPARQEALRKKLDVVEAQRRKGEKLRDELVAERAED